MQRNTPPLILGQRDSDVLAFVHRHSAHVIIAMAITLGFVATLVFSPSSPAGAVAGDSPVADDSPVAPDSRPLATAGIDEDSNPDAASSPVYAIVEANGRYYIGGDFQMVAGESQPYLAAIEVATGRLDQLWRPDVNDTVTALAVSPDGSAIYVGGRFNSINGKFPSRIAKLDTITGALDTTFDPDASAVVNSIATDGTSVWAAGSFATIGGTSQAYIAKMDTSGVVDTAFDPVANGKVLDVELEGNRLYLSGNFTTLDGVTHERIASMNASTGVVDAWAPSSGFKVYDVSLRPSGGILYAAGAGSLRAGGNSLTAWDTTTGALLWRRVDSGDFQAVVATDELVYIGTHGEFVYIDNDGPFLEDDANPNAVRRNKIAAFDPLTGDLDAWNPGANSVWGVWALNLGPSGLLVGGDFTTIGGVAQPHFAVFNGPSAGNKAPLADFSVECTGTSCAFDASASSDPDGTVSSYAWDFGDGQTSTIVAPTIVLDNNSMHTVLLTVTDDQQTSSRTQDLVPVGSGGLDVTLVGVDSSSTTTANVQADLPTDLANGDIAVAFLSIADVTTVITPPNGWTEVGAQASGSANSGVWYAPVDAVDAGTAVSFTFDSTVKANLSVASFRHVDLASPIEAFASEAESSLWAQHSAPTITTTVPAAVLHFWTDRSGDTDRVASPANEATVARIAGTGGGHVNSEVSLVPITAPGVFAESVAIGGLHTRSATSWTVALTALEVTPSCVSTLNVDDTVNLTWTDQNNVNNNIVRRNGKWLATVGAATSYTDTPGPGTWDYLIRVSIAGNSVDLACAPQITIDDPPPFVQTCTATVNGDETITVHWDQIPGENGYSVRRNGSYLATANNTTTYTDNPGPGTWDYVIRSKKAGVQTNTTCAPQITIDAPPPPVQTCTAIENGDGSITLVWDQIAGENSYIVRRNGAWLETTSALTITDVFAQPGDTYLIRSKMAGVQTNTDCT